MSTLTLKITGEAPVPRKAKRRLRIRNPVLLDAAPRHASFSFPRGPRHSSKCRLILPCPRQLRSHHLEEFISMSRLDSASCNIRKSLTRDKREVLIILADPPLPRQHNFETAITREQFERQNRAAPDPIAINEKDTTAANPDETSALRATTLPDTSKAIIPSRKLAAAVQKTPIPKHRIYAIKAKISHFRPPLLLKTANIARVKGNIAVPVSPHATKEKNQILEKLGAACRVKRKGLGRERNTRDDSAKPGGHLVKKNHERMSISEGYSENRPFPSRAASAAATVSKPTSSPGRYEKGKTDLPKAVGHELPLVQATKSISPRTRSAAEKIIAALGYSLPTHSNPPSNNAVQSTPRPGAVLETWSVTAPVAEQTKTASTLRPAAILTTTACPPSIGADVVGPPLKPATSIASSSYPEFRVVTISTPPMPALDSPTSVPSSRLNSVPFWTEDHSRPRRFSRHRKEYLASTGMTRTAIHGRQRLARHLHHQHQLKIERDDKISEFLRWLMLTLQQLRPRRFALGARVAGLFGSIIFKKLCHSRRV